MISCKFFDEKGKEFLNISDVQAFSERFQPDGEIVLSIMFYSEDDISTLSCLQQHDIGKIHFLNNDKLIRQFTVYNIVSDIASNYMDGLDDIQYNISLARK